MGNKHLTALCGDKCAGCPEIYIDDALEENKQVSILDDFGRAISMSKDQLRIFVEQAKAGKLDI